MAEVQAQSLSVTENRRERGDAISARLEKLGIGEREFYRQTGIDRKTLGRAIEGLDTVRGSTYDAIETALTRLEDAVTGKAGRVELSDPEDDFVEFTIEGNFGVRAVVKGPVRDMEQLQKAVSDLVSEMRSTE
jgi:hypothetical protein